MMKNIVIPFVLVTACQFVFAENSDQFLGEFEGTESFAITCSNAAWNSSGNRPWSANHYEVNGNNYKASINTGGGRYEAKGTITGNSASGTFTGKDKFGNTCDGEFTNTLEGDQLKAKSSGSCPTVNCTFTGEVSANRK